MMGQNFIVYLNPETDKFTFAPWDLDRTFGNFITPIPEQLSVRRGWADDNRFLQRVMNVPAVKEAYLARLEEFQESLFRPDLLNQRIDKLATLIRPIVAEEGSENLARFDRAVSGDGKGETSGLAQPGVFRMPTAKPIKEFIKLRHQSVSDQLAGKSEGTPVGFGRPPGGSGGPGGRGFGPGNFLGRGLLKAADADGNSQVSASEFEALATRWFSEWDADANGALSMEQLRDGLAKAFPPPRFDFNPPGRP
jgi:hypothetical protein